MSDSGSRRLLVFGSGSLKVTAVEIAGLAVSALLMDQVKQRTASRWLPWTVLAAGVVATSATRSLIAGRSTNEPRELR